MPRSVTASLLLFWPAYSLNPSRRTPGHRRIEGAPALLITITYTHQEVARHPNTGAPASLTQAQPTHPAYDRRRVNSLASPLRHLHQVPTAVPYLKCQWTQSGQSQRESAGACTSLIPTARVLLEAGSGSHCNGSGDLMYWLARSSDATAIRQMESKPAC